MITLKDLIGVLGDDTYVCLRCVGYPNYRTIAENSFGYMSLDTVGKYLDYYVTSMKLLEGTLEIIVNRG